MNERNVAYTILMNIYLISQRKTLQLRKLIFFSSKSDSLHTFLFAHMSLRTSRNIRENARETNLGIQEVSTRDNLLSFAEHNLHDEFLAVTFYLLVLIKVCPDMSCQDESDM